MDLSELDLNWKGEPGRAERPFGVTYRASPGVVTFESANVSAAGSQIQVSGALPLAAAAGEGALQLNAQLDLPGIARLVPEANLDLQGKASITGDIRGTLSRDHAVAGVVAKGGGFNQTTRALSKIANENAESWLRTIIESAQGCDAILVAGLAAFAGFSAAEYLGVKAIGSGMIPITPTVAFPSPFLPPKWVPRLLNRASHRFVNFALWKAFREKTNAARAMFKLPPIESGPSFTSLTESFPEPPLSVKFPPMVPPSTKMLFVPSRSLIETLLPTMMPLLEASRASPNSPMSGSVSVMVNGPEVAVQ